MKELTVRAETEKLGTVTEFVNAELERIGCPGKARMQIDLAVEEIFVNIASYAYSAVPEGGEAVIRLEASETPPSVIITFEDRGIPFDPTAKEDPDRTTPAEEREIGGLGIFLTKTIMDDVIYEYRDGRNILSIRKRFACR